ncbi:MAG: DUF1232 domain-containing protein [Deltaproteobacteria bacterium]|jgi:uncharacterized membrane protein YkvA (DUF1232 family)|nr:DUF1232 domain-containing protein [Deltaproteobacteria bacterium]
MKTGGQNQQNFSWLRSLGQLPFYLRLIWRLLLDRRVAFTLKLVPLAAMVYFVIPYDLLPELVLPGWGEVDDLLILYFAGRFFLSRIPPAIMAEHLERLS